MCVSSPRTAAPSSKCDYLIRGVAGRILWSVVQRHGQTGQTEFTNKEQRLDRSLALPGFRDNLDTRLVMLKRRLDERDAPMRLERIGRGRVGCSSPRRDGSNPTTESPPTRGVVAV